MSVKTPYWSCTRSFTLLILYQIIPVYPFFFSTYPYFLPGRKNCHPLKLFLFFPKERLQLKHIPWSFATDLACVLLHIVSCLTSNHICIISISPWQQLRFWTAAFFYTCNVCQCCNSRVYMMWHTRSFWERLLSKSGILTADNMLFQPPDPVHFRNTWGRDTWPN